MPLLETPLLETNDRCVGQLGENQNKRKVHAEGRRRLHLKLGKGCRGEQERKLNSRFVACLLAKTEIDSLWGRGQGIHTFFLYSCDSFVVHIAE